MFPWFGSGWRRTTKPKSGFKGMARWLTCGGTLNERLSHLDPREAFLPPLIDHVEDADHNFSKKERSKT